MLSRVEVRVSVMVKDMVMVGFRVRIRVHDTGYAIEKTAACTPLVTRVRVCARAEKAPEPHAPDPTSNPIGEALPLPILGMKKCKSKRDIHMAICLQHRRTVIDTRHRFSHATTRGLAEISKLRP